MKVLLSIKPEFADKIFEGTKRFEFRKSIFRRANVHTVVVYVTSPVSQIVGEFEIEGIVSDEPTRLWSKTKEFAGISKEFFLAYFEGRATAFALEIGCVTKYSKPIIPHQTIKNFTAPQSYMYVDDEFMPLGKSQQLELL